MQKKKKLKFTERRQQHEDTRRVYRVWFLQLTLTTYTKPSTPAQKRYFVNVVVDSSDIVQLEQELRYYRRSLKRTLAIGDLQFRAMTGKSARLVCRSHFRNGTEPVRAIYVAAGTKLRRNFELLAESLDRCQLRQLGFAKTFT